MCATVCTPLAPRDADRCKKPVTGGRRRAAVDAVGREFAVNEVSAAACAVPFAHPVTGAKHTLYVNELAFLHRGPTPRLPQLEEGWLPVIAYEIVPPLPAGEEPELMETGLPPIECTDRWRSAERQRPRPHGTKPRRSLRLGCAARRAARYIWRWQASMLSVEVLCAIPSRCKHPQETARLSRRTR